jgi:hypothetical protein
MAKKTTKTSSLIKRLEDKIFGHEAYLSVAEEMRDLNPEDHPVSSARKRKPTAQEKKDENRSRVELKRLRQMLKNAKARGGGSLGGNTVGNLATGSRNKTVKKLMENM